jgi:hypothetical protein
MKGDFSRSTFRSDRPYSGVRMQQGRVPLDADWNEQVDISDYIRRRALVDIIGGCCIPRSEPNSFRVSTAGNGLRVEGGRAWVQGVLAERPDAQTIPVPQQAGRHVVYLEVFERHVTAIEDPEIREVALGGPDTATRTETVCRAGAAPLDGNQGCADLRDFAPPGQTTGQLTATTGAQPADTPCVVPTAAGYTRLENQLYRVEIQRGGGVGGATPATLKWSRDNGSIAAEWLELDGNEIVIADPGRDDVLGFHENRWLELSHDGLDLAGEPGVLVEIVSRRTSSDGRFRMEFDAHGQVVPDPATLAHPKVRRWDHDAGSDVNVGSIPIAAANTGISIEGGIEVRFSAGHYRAGDYWLIPARTFSGATTGDILWPRDGSGNALPQSPHGVARYFCRLAVVSSSGTSVQVLEDCRSTFPTLCGLERTGGGGCCTVTVGRVGGDVPTIAEALSRLPDDGGEICILPGDYREHVVLDNRRDVAIHGCGRRTRIISDDSRPAFSLRDAENVTIRSLSVQALEGNAFFLNDARSVTIDDVTVVGRDRTAIVAIDSRRVTLADSVIAFTSVGEAALSASRPIAVFVAGLDLTITGNQIRAFGHDGVSSLPAGGLQIGGGSERVLVRGNTIDGGCGPGIVLGSVSTRPASGPSFPTVFEDFVARGERDPARAIRSTALDDTASFYAKLQRQPGGTTLMDHPQLGLVARLPTGGNVISDGDLTQVRLVENQVRNMGGSGVTAVHFFDLVEGDGDFISVHDLEITGNVIEDCLRMPQQPIPERLSEDIALGGVALADVDALIISDNTIDRTASRVRTPCCGVFVLHSLGLDIHRNRIRHNGMPPQEITDDRAGQIGRRGGIVVGFAEVPTREIRLRPESTVTRQRQDGTPAMRIHDNIVVSPDGRALEAIALGPVSVEGNQMTALGADFRLRSTRSPLGLDVPEGSPFATFTSAFGGAVVFLFNLGVSNEVYGQLAGFSGLNLDEQLPQPDDGEDKDRGVLAGGNIQFVDNQVVLDALDGVSTFALSAITLLTLDDISCSDNQSDCDLALDVVATNAMALGLSARFVANRFKQGIANAFYSAFTLAYMNTTVDNQGTHCFVRIGRQNPPPGENMVLLQLLPGGERACESADALENTMRKAIFQS